MNVFRQKFLGESWSAKLTADEDTTVKVKDQVTYVPLDGRWVPEDEADEIATDMKFLSSPIAKIPPEGYRDRFSKVSIKWLEWMSRRDGVHIQHALNGGEKVLPEIRYKLDSFCQETNTAYEFNGCAFHGCQDCFKDQTKSTYPLTKQSMKELYALTIKKKKIHRNPGNEMCFHLGKHISSTVCQ